MMTVRIIVSGRVQGVGYRQWTLAEARSLGLAGYVFNRIDGDVEAVFHGAESAVGTMLERCRRGPFFARVTNVAERPAEVPPSDGFSIEVTR
ncbi:MAG: acylphosphatase [Gammaproteobacteria bacterium]|nr:acylphosphatase [Gammaproteobacteria bacterium]